jgi:predicted MPP superfamily phosphohydrolase
MAVPFVMTVAVFLGVLLFLISQVQSSPGPTAWGRTPRWMKRIRVALATIPVVIAVLVIWAFFVEPSLLVLRQETIQINQWPNELNGLRIAIISDIHVGSRFIDQDKVRFIVERTNELHPDMVVILGDYIHGGRNSAAVYPETFAPTLGGLKAPLGVYSVLGNHDWWWNGNRVREALDANGIKVLDDEVVELQHRGRSFWLAGLADLWTRPQHIDKTIAKVPAGELIIAMTHNPDIFPRVPQRVSLLLAGHTHGGQVQIPIIGSVVQASDYGVRYLSGHVFEQNHHLFVTTGVGTSIVPVRFSVPPEIVLLTVKSEQ